MPGRADFLWVSTFLTLGYLVGENWKQIAQSTETYALYASIALAAAALVYYVIRRVRPRAE